MPYASSVDTGGIITSLPFDIPQTYGVRGDGVTDDTSAFNDFFNLLDDGADVYVPPGIYVVSGLLKYPARIRLRGAGNNSNGTIFRVAAGTGLTTPVLASAAWQDNSDYSGYPVHFSDFSIDCTESGAMSGTSAHGLVITNHYSSFERISIAGATGHNFLLTAHVRDTTHILNTCVEVKFVRCESRDAGQYGFYVEDDGTGLNSCTDGWFEGCISADSTLDGFRCAMAPGWEAYVNHSYGNGRMGMYFDKGYGTRLEGNYSDSDLLGAEFDAGIYLGVLDGRGSSCIGNHVGFESASGSNRRGIKLVGRGSNTSMVTCVGNTVNGGSQTGSVGFSYIAQGSQIGHAYYVSVAGNYAQNCASASSADANTTVVSNTTY